MKEIILPAELTAIVDDNDYDWLMQWPWHIGNQYAMRGRRNPEPRRPALISMQRHLMQPPPELVVDHLNGDTLDNRRSNLRVVTRKMNSSNLPWRRSEKGRFMTPTEILRALPKTVVRGDSMMVFRAIWSSELPSLYYSNSLFIRREDGEAYIRSKILDDT